MPIEPKNSQGKDINPQQDFNIKSERALDNRMASYDLTKDEKAKIWEIAKERDTMLQKTQEYYSKNWKTFYDAEKTRLIKEQKISPEGPRPIGGRTPSIPHKARQNVSNAHHQNLNNIRQDAGKKMNNIFDHASSQGRGPKQEQNRSQNQQQSKTLTQEFNRNDR